MTSEVEELLGCNDLNKFNWNDKVLIQKLSNHPLV